MGVRTFVLEKGTMQIMIGDRPYTAGLLRDIGKPSPQATSATIKASRAWPAGAAMPPVVLANRGGGTFEVLAWEQGMTSTNDYDWSDLRQLGTAVRSDPSHNPVLMLQDGRTPMTIDDARNAGIIDPNGQLVPGRLPRVITAVCEEIVTPHANPGSLGQGKDVRYEFILLMDNGRERRFGIYQKMVEGTAEAAANGMLGMTLSEAHDWASVHVVSPNSIDEGREIAVIGGEKMIFTSDNPQRDVGCIQVIPVSGDDGVPGQKGGILILGSIGGAGYAQLPQFGILDIGERAARGWPNAGVQVQPQGHVALSAGQGMGSVWLMLRPNQGSLELLCGFPAPELTNRFMSEDELNLLQLRACEHVAVSPSRVNDFLADFAGYLEVLGAASLARGPSSEPLPTPAIHFGELGIDHSQPARRQHDRNNRSG